MSQTLSINATVIQQWLDQKLDAQAIQNNLSTLGWDDETIVSHLREFKRMKYAKRRTTGFVYLALGAFLGFISCVLTLINPIPALYNLILFGLTSLAILIICLGLYYVLE